MHARLFHMYQHALQKKSSTSEEKKVKAKTKAKAKAEAMCIKAKLKTKAKAKAKARAMAEAGERTALANTPAKTAAKTPPPTTSAAWIDLDIMLILILTNNLIRNNMYLLQVTQVLMKRVLDFHIS